MLMRLPICCMCMHASHHTLAHHAYTGPRFVSVPSTYAFKELRSKQNTSQRLYNETEFYFLEKNNLRFVIVSLFTPNSTFMPLRTIAQRRHSLRHVTWSTGSIIPNVDKLFEKEALRDKKNLFERHHATKVSCYKILKKCITRIRAVAEF